jgi:hypothetical protein
MCVLSRRSPDVMLRVRWGFVKMIVVDKRDRRPAQREAPGDLPQCQGPEWYLSNLGWFQGITLFLPVNRYSKINVTIGLPPRKWLIDDRMKVMLLGLIRQRFDDLILVLLARVFGCFITRE